MEVLRALVHRGQDPQLYVWRTADGHEVDLVVEASGQLLLIEIKLTTTPHPGMAAGIVALREALGAKVGPGGWSIRAIRSCRLARACVPFPLPSSEHR